MSERWVWWRGRPWRLAGGAEDGEREAGTAESGPEVSGGPAGGEAAETDELAAARARIAELEASAATATAELEQARRGASEAAALALAAHRRALLAEHRGRVVDELVQGGTVEELEASVAAAQAAYERVAETARQAAADERIPAGAGARGEADLERLSPLAKIARGLRG